MANAYFLNAQGAAQTADISVTVNSGSAHVLSGFKAAPQTSFVHLPLGPNKGKDILGTDDVNEVVVTTLNTSQQVVWQVSMTGISPNNDIQFLVFENTLVARQGSTVSGFAVTRV